ncbi:hypothetical protein SporoP37_15100 [Sporosarcina sp. P37]|uniref:DUF1641 domain-containing protein n=1 Tax=unclassified Sporosarcina TaxID=2647733 RepID=UPI000A17D1E0|nr:MULTISPECIES: DUF1641 domain-containing protein [unclassified Sporosarcina]ARK25860.1 hypothetical protein SporoP37_15100 [Sporosarcina sp. P37]PID19116.1 DUF1641 domain-containing protein [Sporosarcina sp. P35]
MAAPITSIKRKERSEMEVQQEKLAELQKQIAEQEESLQKVMELTGELHKIGALDALQAMLQSKEKITGIALGQVSREPVTNMLNNLMAGAGVLTALDPATVKQLSQSVQKGLSEAEQGNAEGQKTSLLQLMKSMNDPDINRALTFGLNFLKGMGKGLEDSSE